MPFKVGNVIGTPKGDYKCQSDDLTAELRAAAAFCGYNSFTVFIDGNQVNDPMELQTNSLKALAATARIEGVEDHEIRVGVYNKPA